MRILTICHGNINRSPLSAAIARSYGHEVRTGGLSPASAGGMRAAKKTRDKVLPLGYDLMEHRSRRVKEDDVEWAEWVILYDNGNEKRFLNEFPEHAHKMVKLGIKDPGFMGKNTPEFHETIDKVIDLTRAWLDGYEEGMRA